MRHRPGVDGRYALTYLVAFVLEQGVFAVLRLRRWQGLVVVIVTVVDTTFHIFGRRRIVSIFLPVGILCGAARIGGLLHLSVQRPSLLRTPPHPPSTEIGG